MRSLAEMFKALADETRLMMLVLLFNKKELCVCDFVGALDISQSKASRHLRSLVHAGFLADRRDAIWVHYRIAENLNDDHKAILNTLKKHLVAEHTDDLLEKLEAWLCSKKLFEGCCKPKAAG